MTRFRLGCLLGLWLIGILLLVLSFLHGGTWALTYSLAALAVMAVVGVLGFWECRRGRSTVQ